MSRKTTAFLCCLAAICVGCHRKQPSAPKEQPAAQQPAPAAPAAPSAPSATPAPPQQAGPDEISEIGLGDKTFADRLLRGFYEPNGSWRWTRRVFAVSLDIPKPEARTYVDLDFTLPTELMNDTGPVTLIARVNGQEVGRRSYARTGRYYLMYETPLALLHKKSPAVVEFELDKAAKDPSNGRELGLIAVGTALRHYEETEIGRDTLLRRTHKGYQELLKLRQQKMPLKTQHELMKLFHEIPIWEHMYFHKVQIEKNPLDLWMMQQIIFEQQPDFVVETGTLFGGSALYWAHTLNGMGLENSRVITVDISDYTKPATADFLWSKYVTFMLGSSTDPNIVSRIAGRVKGKKVIVCLDSDHSMAHVFEELKMYTPMINRGSYIIVEDTHMDGVPTHPGVPGPMAAVQKFLAEGGSKDFEQDFTREAFIMTFNPGGWLQRK